MIYLNQNLFSLGRQNVRANSNLSVSFEQRGKDLLSIYHYFFTNIEIFNVLKYRKTIIITLLLIKPRIKKFKLN